MINWSGFLEMFLLGCVGSIIVESMKLYELRSKLHFKKYKKIYTSFLFWGATFLFVFSSGFIAWAMNENNPNVTVWQLVLTGMGASALVKKIGELIANKESLHAGIDERITLKDLFK